MAIVQAESATAVAVIAQAAVDSQTVVVATATNNLTAAQTALDALKDAPENTKVYTTDGYVAPVAPETATVTTTTLPTMYDASTKIETPFDIKMGDILYNGQGPNSQIYVTSKATITFGTGDHTWWDFPGGPSISVFASDYMNAGPGTSTVVTTTETTLEVDWNLKKFGDNNAPITNINWKMTVNPTTGEWTGIGTVAGNTTNLWYPQRTGVRETAGQPVQQMTEVTSATIAAAETVVADKAEVKTEAVATLTTLTETATATVATANQLANVAVEKVEVAVTALSAPVVSPEPQQPSTPPVEPTPVPAPVPTPPAQESSQPTAPQNPEPSTPQQPVEPSQPQQPTEPQTPSDPSTTPSDPADNNNSDNNTSPEEETPDVPPTPEDGDDTSTPESEDPQPTPEEPSENESSDESDETSTESPTEESSNPTEEPTEPEDTEQTDEETSEPSDPTDVVEEPESPQQSQETEQENQSTESSQNDTPTEEKITALLEQAGSAPVSTEAIKEAGLTYSDLPPATPVEVRTDEDGNAVIITAEVAAALVLLENPAELLGAIFENPAQALTALGNIGADMSEEERQEAEKIVVAAVIAGQAAVNAATMAAAATTSSTTGGSSGGGGPSGGSSKGGDKILRRRGKW